MGFFFYKSNILLFKLIEYTKYNHIFNIVKCVNDKSANKLTTPKLITYNGKMATNDTIESK
jgi:hypothetical protein